MPKRKAVVIDPYVPSVTLVEYDASKPMEFVRSVLHKNPNHVGVHEADEGDVGVIFGVERRKEFAWDPRWGGGPMAADNFGRAVILGKRLPDGTFEDGAKEEAELANMQRNISFSCVSVGETAFVAAVHKEVASSHPLVGLQKMMGRLLPLDANEQPAWETPRQTLEQTYELFQAPVTPDALAAKEATKAHAAEEARLKAMH